MCPSGGWIGQHFVVPNWLDPVLMHSPFSWQTIGCTYNNNSDDSHRPHYYLSLRQDCHNDTSPCVHLTLIDNTMYKSNYIYALFNSHHSTKATGSAKKKPFWFNWRNTHCMTRESLCQCCEPTLKGFLCVTGVLSDYHGVWSRLSCRPVKT